MKKLLAITILVLQGCASTLKLDPMALDGQHKVLQEGVEAIISPKKALVAIRPGAKTYSSKGRPTIHVTVVNGTKEPFKFSAEDVQVFVDGASHKVFTYDELVAEAKRRQAWTTIADISATMLKKTTVLPKAWHEGHVTIEKISKTDHPRDIKVAIRFAGEKHEFLLKYFKVQQ